MSLFPRYDRFESRHIGTLGADLSNMLRTIGVNSLDELIRQTVPDQIRLSRPLQTPPAMAEFDYLSHLKGIAAKNKLNRSLIGQAILAP
jgi:glycine dehydrogenase